MAKLKLKKGDHVIVLAGKDKGRPGTISRVIPASDKTAMATRRIRVVRSAADFMLAAGVSE